jgi:hypothetical protein
MPRVRKIMPTKKRPTKKTVKTSSAPYTTRALPGKSGKSKEIDPSQQSLEALSATLTEVNEPRPYLSRYPIPEQKFNQMKEAALKIKLPKKDAPIAKDAGAAARAGMMWSAFSLSPGAMT